MIFESQGISGSKSLLMARYLIEPPSQGELILNEQAQSTQGEIIRELKETIGVYRLYKSEGHEIDDDTNYVSEEYMKKVVMENFGRCRESLKQNLESESLDGGLNLETLYEAIIDV